MNLKTNDRVLLIESGRHGIVRKVGRTKNRPLLVEADRHFAWLEPHEVEPLNMAKEEPAIRAANKAYRSTKVFQLDQLLELESKWKRKVTIASNKLADVREQITKLAKEMAQDSVKPQGKTLCEVFADEAKSKEVPS